MQPRKIVAVADIGVPPTKGDEEKREWRGVLYESGELEYYVSNEFFDFDRVDEVPGPVSLCLDYLLAWRALDEPDEV